MPQDRVGELLSAGFTPDEVGAWATRQREILAAGGFGESEINDYIGGKPPPVSRSFLNRLAGGLATGLTAESAEAARAGPGGRFLAGLGKGLVLPAESLKQTLQDAGVAEAAGITLGRVPIGAVVDQIRQGGESLKAAMTGQPVGAEEMVGASLLGLTAPVSRLPGGVARIDRSPLGEVHVAPIGELPRAESFAEAKSAALGPEPAPQAYGAIEKLWEDHGIHPAEVAHDAVRDVTITQDLAAGRVPQAYVPSKTPETTTSGALEIPEGGYRTSKGSVYEVHDDGTTTRFKSYHPEHGTEDQGLQPRSEATIYVTPEDVNKLGEVQVRGGATASVAPLGDGRWGVKYLDGKDAGKFESRTVVMPETEPAVGLTPVEIFDGGQRVHFGNKISQLAPVPARAKPIEIPVEESATAAGTLEATPVEVKSGIAGTLRDFAQSEEGTLRLGKPEPPRTPAEKAILDRLSVGETDSGRKWTWDRFYTAMVDRLHPINEAVSEAGGAARAAEDPYKLARLYAGVSGKADHWLTYGSFDFNTYRNTGKGLKEILAPVSDDLNGFRAYATALRALELEQQGIKTGMDLAQAREVARAGDAKYTSVMAELVGYQNRLARYLRNSGVLSHEGFAAMTAKHQLYIPFQRVFGDVMGDIIPDVIRGQGKSLQASDTIHTIVGSERRVIDPLESIVRNTYLSVMMAERNAVGTKLVDLLQKAGGMPTPERVDTISIYRNGVKETHEVSVDLAAAMKGLDEESANTMLRVLGAPARMLRAGATLSPDFMLRNPIRDFFSAVINTTKGAFSPIDTVKGFASAISKDAAFQEWLKGGGANSALVSLDRRYLQQNLAKLTAETGLGDRAWNVVRHPIDTLRAISQITEEATRLGEFRAAQKRELAAGATAKEAAQEAAFASREVTLDFARRGAMTRSMNMITAFWNAQVHGVDRIGRAFKDDPAGTSLKIAAGVTIPSILLWWNNHQDPRWKEVPDWERDLFWLIMTKDHIYRIPKPFEVGVLFGSGVERLLDAFIDQKLDAFRDFSKSIMSALLPTIIPTVALPVVEQFANRSSFIDRPLIPQSQEKLLPEYQYEPYTTETAKALGQIIGAFPGIRDAKLGDSAGGGVSRALSTPILLENYVRAWTGGLGNYALHTADLGLRKAGVLPDPPKPDDTLADIPVVKAFVVRYPAAGSQSIQHFYDEYDKNKRYFDSFQAKAKEGDIAAMQHIQQMGGPRLFVQLDSIKKALTTQSQFVRDVYKNPAMTPAEKRQLIDTTYMRQIEIARAGVDVMRRVDAALVGQ